MGWFGFGKSTTKWDVKFDIKKRREIFETEVLETKAAEVRSEFPKLRRGDKGNIRLSKENLELVQQIANNPKWFEWFNDNANKLARTKVHAGQEMKDELGNFRRAVTSDIVDPAKFEAAYANILRITEKMQIHSKRFTLALKLFVNMYIQGLYKAIVEYNDAEQIEGDSELSEEVFTAISIDELIDAKLEAIADISKRIQQDFISHNFRADFMQQKEFPEKVFREFENLWNILVDIEMRLRESAKKLVHKAKKLNLETTVYIKEMEKKFRKTNWEKAGEAGIWYAKFRENHPFMCSATATVLLLAGTVGAIAGLAGVTTGLLGILGGARFALISGVGFAFASDWGITLIQKLRGT